MKRTLLACLGALLLIPAPAVAFDQQAEVFNYAKSLERFKNDDLSVGFQQQLALQSLSNTISLAQALADNPSHLPVNPCGVPIDLCVGDPRIYDWGNKYGLVRPIHYVNRNGALISGHMWAPVTQKRLPVVLFVNGDLAPESIYWFAAQAIARSGYVVMTYDPQGHGASDTFGDGPDRFRNVIVQQAAGTDELNAEADADSAEQVSDALGFLLSTHKRHYTPLRPSGRAKQQTLAASHKVEAFDPLIGVIDARELGLIGHSRGADAVSIVGTRDHRVKTIVAWDNLMAGTAADAANPSKPVAPRVPALGMSGDYYIADPPYTSAPPRHAKDAAFTAYRKAHIDTMELIVRGGTHFEWSYIPGPVLGTATLRGIDMATWYAQAWFDKYLKHIPSAERRLLSKRWRQDPGGGAVDLQHDGNLFSFYYPSQISIHTVKRRHDTRHSRCVDVRAGCRFLVPKAKDGYPGEYSYLRARQG